MTASDASVVRSRHQPPGEAIEGVHAAHLDTARKAGAPGLDRVLLPARRAPYEQHGRSAGGTLIGLSMRGRCDGGGCRRGGCLAGFSVVASSATLASTPEALRGLSLASPISGAAASPPSTVAPSASRKSLSGAVEMPSFLWPRETAAPAAVRARRCALPAAYQSQHGAVSSLRQELTQNLQHRPALLTRRARCRRRRRSYVAHRFSLPTAIAERKQVRAAT
jgi:hypothetical protein